MLPIKHVLYNFQFFDVYSSVEIYVVSWFKPIKSLLIGTSIMLIECLFLSLSEQSQTLTTIQYHSRQFKLCHVICKAILKN